MLFYSSIALGILATMMVDSGSSSRDLVASPSTQQSPVDAALSQIVNDPVCPLASLSTAVVRDGKIVYLKQIGYRWIDNANPQNSKPADAKTLYRIASISKLITALGVMKLVDEGKLDLDTDVSTYLGFRLRNPHFADKVVTLRMMLCHTSSLRDDEGYYWDYKSGITLADVLLPGGKKYGKGEMWATNAGPGEYFQYANLPWGVIGTIMERATGERFDKLMQRLVLDPMDIAGGYSPTDLSPAEINNVATLYRKRSAEDENGEWNPAGDWKVQTDDFLTNPPPVRAGEGYIIGSNGTLFGPQGNCRLSAAGLGKVMIMLMSEGTLDGKQILSKASVNLMLSEQWKHHVRSGPISGDGNSGGEASEQDIHAMNSWGLGVQHFLDITGKGAGDRLVEGGGFVASGHTGEAYGLTGAMVFDPIGKIGLIYLVGGVGSDPNLISGKYSAMFRYEERILSTLWQVARPQP